MIRYGVHHQLEEAANALLAQQTSRQNRQQKEDILTPWKEKDRTSREVYVSTGTPDSSLVKGNFNRAWNSHPAHSHLNSPGMGGGQRRLGYNDASVYVNGRSEQTDLSE